MDKRFAEVLDSVEPIMYTKFQKILMTGYRDMVKNIKSAPKLGFPPFLTPMIFFQKSGSVTFVSLRCANFMQKIKKTDGRSLIYLKTDHRRTGGLHRTLSEEPESKT